MTRHLTCRTQVDIHLNRLETDVQSGNRCCLRFRYLTLATRMRLASDSSPGIVWSVGQSGVISVGRESYDRSEFGSMPPDGMHFATGVLSRYSTISRKRTRSVRPSGTSPAQCRVTIRTCRRDKYGSPPMPLRNQASGESERSITFAVANNC